MLPRLELLGPMTLDRAQTSPILPAITGVELCLRIEFQRFLGGSTDDLDC